MAHIATGSCLEDTDSDSMWGVLEVFDVLFLIQPRLFYNLIKSTISCYIYGFKISLSWAKLKINLCKKCQRRSSHLLHMRFKAMYGSISKLINTQWHVIQQVVTTLIFTLYIFAQMNWNYFYILHVICIFNN